MIYEKIKNLCAINGTTITALGNELGFGCGSIANWRRGGTPRIETVKKIAEHFNVPVNYLLGIEDAPVSFSGNTINGNNNIIGNGNSPPEPLNEQEIALVNLFRTLDEIERAEVIAAAARFRRARLNQERNGE